MKRKDEAGVIGHEIVVGGGTRGALTSTLLLCGVAVAPLFFAVVFVQASTRSGFDLRRAPLSLLSLGEMGWIQIANFIVTGLLGLACAFGMRQALKGGKGGTWGPLLTAAFGLGLILAGLFHPDPGYSFPPGSGAPVGMLPTMSRHAAIHSLGFLIVVLSLIAACFVFARRFRAVGQTGWSNYSAATGIVAPILIGLGVGTNTTPLLTLMAVLTYGWLSLVAWRLLSEGKGLTQ